MTDFYALMNASSLPYFEYGVSAFDRYKGLTPQEPIRFFAVSGSLVDVARLFDSVEYPSLPYADASIGTSSIGFEARIKCIEDPAQAESHVSPLMEFRWNPRNGYFLDPASVYRNLRQDQLVLSGSDSENALFETAVLLSRFPCPEDQHAGCDSVLRAYASMGLPDSVSEVFQKDLLEIILQGRYASQALDFLERAGFVKKFWPVLAALTDVDHAKDCHPEGGGWSHTMEALSQRKTRDRTISLAILLHDIGKPLSTHNEGRRFDRHAEIGAELASRFLRFLHFEEKLIEDVRFMIRWHMMVAALPRLPLSSVSSVVFDQRFPDLLEVFRCDEFSTFKGPDVYYASCAAYRQIMKNRKNPYRSDTGEKLRAGAPQGMKRHA
ncbi:MAG: HD domain-containing protein [Spirochaetia bacterium]|nr:HD domain-containing protein [Spirochaetia bacterium]